MQRLLWGIVLLTVIFMAFIVAILTFKPALNTDKYWVYYLPRENDSMVHKTPEIVTTRYYDLYLKDIQYHIPVNISYLPCAHFAAPNIPTGSTPQYFLVTSDNGQLVLKDNLWHVRCEV